MTDPELEQISIISKLKMSGNNGDFLGKTLFCPVFQDDWLMVSPGIPAALNQSLSIERPQLSKKCFILAGTFNNSLDPETTDFPKLRGRALNDGNFFRRIKLSKKSDF